MSNKLIRPLLAVVVVVAAALTAWSLPAASEAFPGANGKIAFAKDAEVGSNIWVMDNDGSNPVQLTDGGGLFDFAPQWSPDGTKVLFVREFAEFQAAFVINADGSGETQLTPDTISVGAPTWSADGSKVYFDAFPEPSTGSGPALFSIDADGANLTQVTTDNDWDRWPSVSPDGTKLAFTRDDPDTGATQIWVADIDGSNAVQLTDSAVSSDQAFIPSWAPDGSRIAYQYRTGPTPDYSAWVMNADGSNPTQVLAGDVGHPKWSPDGNLLALSYSDGTDAGIWTIHPDGSGLQIVLSGTVYDPAWQRLAAPVKPTTTTTTAPAVAADTVTPAFTG